MFSKKKAELQLAAAQAGEAKDQLIEELLKRFQAQGLSNLSIHIFRSGVVDGLIHLTVRAKANGVERSVSWDVRE